MTKPTYDELMDAIMDLCEAQVKYRESRVCRPRYLAQGKTGCTSEPHSVFAAAHNLVRDYHGYEMFNGKWEKLVEGAKLPDDLNTPEMRAYIAQLAATYSPEEDN